jgi:two-component system, NtrC family, sensor histidine kinase KinB
MSVDLLLEHVAQGLAEKDRDLLQAAHEEVHRMKALVNDLLDLSRIEGGRIEMEFERVPVNTLFDQIQTIFKSQMEMKEVSLTVKMAVDDLPKHSRGCQQDHLGSYQSDLQCPALCKQGRPYPVSWHTGSDRRFTLAVRDDGPGIP